MPAGRGQGDGAAHGVPGQAGLGQIQGVQQGAGVIRQAVNVKRRGRRARPADAAVVEDDHPEFFRQRAAHGRPGVMRRSQPRNANQRRALSLLLVIDFHAAGGNHWHAAPPNSIIEFGNRNILTRSRPDTKQKTFRQWWNSALVYATLKQYSA